MPVPNVVPKVLLSDPAANRFTDQLLAVLNPILRNVAGDLTGPVAAPSVRGWFGLPLAESMGAPAVGQVPAWNGTAWAPSTGAGGGIASVTATAPITSTGGTNPDIAISGTPAGGAAYANGSTLAYTAAGTTGAPLVSGGAGAPSFAALDLALAAAVTGILPIARGGTNGSASPVSGGVAYGAAGAYAFTGAGTAGFPLLSNGAGAPAFGALSLSTPGLLSGVLPIANGGTNGSATPTAGAIPYGTGTAYAFTAAGTSGYLLTSGGSGPPTWEVPSASFTGAGIGAYRATTTTPDTIALSDYTVDVNTTGAFTVNLPTAGSGAGQAATGRVFVVKNSGGATVTVAPAGAQLVDGAASFTIVTQYASFTFQSTGSGWVLL